MNVLLKHGRQGGYGMRKLLDFVLFRVVILVVDCLFFRQFRN